MKTIIAGSRNAVGFSENQISFLNSMIGIVTEVVSGGCSGIDRLGEQWAKENKIPVRVFHADWANHGRSAGPKRNRQMAEYADAVILFPGGRGTESMRREAKSAGIKIYEAV